MTELDLQQLLQNQSGGGSQPLFDPSTMLTTALEPLMPILTLLFYVGIGLTVLIVIFFIVNIFQKQRQHAAIMRIDRNLQKLVDAKGLTGDTPTKEEPKPEPVAERPAQLVQ